MPVTAGRLAAIGEELAVQGFGLVGVLIEPAEDPDAVMRAWAGLPEDVVVVILTPAAASAIPPRAADALPLTVVMPA